MPIVVLRLYWRSIKEPGYRHALSERFGFFRSKTPGEVVWIHAVSAGETIAAVPLIRRLKARGYKCLVTNMTPTGRERVRVLLGDGVENCYAPYDLPGSVNRFLENNSPRALITIDTELWPNILSSCEQKGIKTMVVNGRMSARSAAGYARIARPVASMLQSINLLAVQTEQHAKRFASLGADKKNLRVTGSIKFDGQYAAGHENRLAAARRMVCGRPVLLGASTHEGEESALLSLLPALESVLPGVVLILAPRHTHRCAQVEKLCKSLGRPAVRFSKISRKQIEPHQQILILDIMGEMESFFPVARLAFIGGSLVPVGGHNLLEAVRAGTAVIMGPHLDNIEDIAQQFVDQNAMSLVQNVDELHDEVIGFMRDEGKVRRLVTSADRVLDANRGSLDRVETLFVELMNDD